MIASRGRAGTRLGFGLPGTEERSGLNVAAPRVGRGERANAQAVVRGVLPVADLP